MNVLSLISTKGGSGKSTIAMSLSAAFAETKKVIVLDTDDQATLAEWFAARHENPNLQMAQVEAEKLPEIVPKLQGFDLVIIDTQGRGSPTTRVEANVADFVLIPCRPTITDVRAAANTSATVRESGTPFAFVTTQGHHMPGRSKQSEAALVHLGPVCPVRIVARAEYQDASVKSQGVTEYKPDGKGAAEIKQLVDWLNKQMGS